MKSVIDLPTVIDASVAAKWFIKESDSHLADQLLHEATLLFAPPIIRTEVAAAIAKDQRMHQVDAAIAQDYFALWETYLSRNLIILEEAEEDLTTAFALSLQTRHPLQDWCYMALSKRRDLPLITADKVQAQKAKQAGLDVILLDAMQ